MVQGDGDVSAAFCSLPFDHLFFTGSTAVGRMVAKAAAANRIELAIAVANSP